MTLKETIPLMVSEDYKERFKAEFYQLQIRHEKLVDMLEKYRTNTLDFKPNTPYEVLLIQCNEMNNYLSSLALRAEIENIDLGEA